MKIQHLEMRYVQDMPAALIPLATDLRWTWSHAGDVVLQNLTRERLVELS